MNNIKRHRTRKSPQKTRKSRSRQETTPILPINTSDRKLRIITNKGHIFHVFDEFESRIRILPANKSSSCIQVLINKEDRSAILEEVSYYQSCSKKDGGLPSKDGTKHMCQVILRYLVDKYKFIDRVDVVDKSAYNITKDKLSFITARYLLQGKPGLYQNYLNAKSTEETKMLIELIEEKRQILNELQYRIVAMKSNDWWTSEHIQSLIDHVFKDAPLKASRIKRVIFDNTWMISKTDIQNYDVTYSTELVKSFEGGFQYKDSYPTYINNVIPIVSRQNFPREAE